MDHPVLTVFTCCLVRVLTAYCIYLQLRCGQVHNIPGGLCGEQQRAARVLAGKPRGGEDDPVRHGGGRPVQARAHRLPGQEHPRLHSRQRQALEVSRSVSRRDYKRLLGGVIRAILYER